MELATQCSATKIILIPALKKNVIQEQKDVIFYPWEVMLLLFSELPLTACLTNRDRVFSQISPVDETVREKRLGVVTGGGF